MLKRVLACLIFCSLLLAAGTQLVSAQKGDQQVATVEKVKIKIAKLGVGAFLAAIAISLAHLD